jgi:hypothetical protein
LKFKQPFFITPHAVRRFQEKVAPLPARVVIRIIQKVLQNPGTPVDIEYRGGNLLPIFAAMYKGQPFYIPVAPGDAEKGLWPSVPTILGKDSILHGKVCRKEVMPCSRRSRRRS